MQIVTKRPLGFQLYPTQRHFERLITNPKYKYLGFSGPVGSGKSRVLGFMAMYMAMLNAGRDGVVTAPSYPQMRDVTRKAIIEVLRLSKTPYEPKLSANEIYLPEFGSTIALRSARDPDALVGTNLAWFGCDELTFTPEESFNNLQARLRDPSGKTLRGFACWTPRGFDWVYRRFINEQERPTDCMAVLGKPFENRAALAKTPDYYSSMQQSYDPRYYRQQVLGEYLNIGSGQVYYCFDREKNHADTLYTPGLPIYLSLDFNVDPMTGVILQAIPANRHASIAHYTIRVLDEIYLRGANTIVACQAFVDKVKQYIPRNQRVKVMITGDHTASRNTTNSDESDYEIIRRFFNNPDISAYVDAQVIVPVTKNPPIRARVNAVNGKLCNSVDERYLFLDTKKCRMLARDLEEVVWDKRSAAEDQTTNPMLTHISSALGYFIHDRYPLQDSIGFKSKGFYS